MATKTLVEKIEDLPAAKRVEVERFVDALSAASTPMERSDLVARLRARRERLLREHGLFDSLPIIRELRETGE